MYNFEVMENDFLEWEPLYWESTPFWWNSSTKNFEVYSNLDLKNSNSLNCRMYRAAGSWVLEQVNFGENAPYFVVTDLPLFRRLTLAQCLAACCYLWSYKIDLKKMSEDQSRLRELEIIRSAIEHIALSPPDWLSSIESSFSN
jgi:hypothetical protein